MKILAIGDFQGEFPKRLRDKLKKEDFDVVIGVGDYTGLAEWRPLIMEQLRCAKEGKPAPDGEEFFGKRKYRQLLKKDWNKGKEVLKQINSLNKPTFIVFGNTDWYKYPFQNNFTDVFMQNKFYDDFVKKLNNITNINYKKSKFNGINLVGFGGYMDIDAYFDKKQWKESDSRKKVQKRLKRHNLVRERLFSVLSKTKGERILVFHYPPKGAFDIIKSSKDNPMNGKSAGVKFYSDAIKKYKPIVVLCGHMHEYRGMKKLHGVPVINPGDGEKGKCAIIEIENDKFKGMKLIG